MSRQSALSNTGMLRLFAHLATFLTVSCWGTSFVCTKVLMEDGGLTPIEVYTYRFAAAYILLLCFTFRKLRSHSLKDEFTFFIAGICSGTIYFILENVALKHTGVANVSLLSSLSPIFTTILFAVIFKAKISAGDYIGSLIAFGGAACVIFSHGEGLEISPLGDILALCSALSWAVYSLVIKPLLPHYNSLFITRKLFLYGVLSSLPFLFIQGGSYHIAELFDLSQPKYLFNFLFLVLFCSMAAYLIWNESMKILGSVTTNNYIYAQPLVTMVVGFFVLGESITTLGYIGCVLIIGGLVIADKFKAKTQ